MLPAGFEPAIPASDRLQTHALNRAATLKYTLQIYIYIYIMRSNLKQIEAGINNSCVQDRILMGG